MPKDNLHHGGAEHRDIHNLYGTMYHEATAQGLIARGTAVHGKDGDRPFVLSRAFFSGTQVLCACHPKPHLDPGLKSATCTRISASHDR